MIELKYILLILTRPASLETTAIVKTVCHTQPARGRMQHAILEIIGIGLDAGREGEVKPVW